MATNTMGISARGRTGKGAVSNGTRTLPGVDGRSPLSRRYRDIASQIVADQGGLSEISESRLQLIRRFAGASVLAEQMEADLANGLVVDLTQHALLTSTLCRISARIGVDRIPKDISASDGLSVAVSDTVHFGYLDEHGRTVITRSEERE